MNELIQLYIVDYYYRPDNIIQDGKLSAWLQSPAFKQNLKDFLDNRVWRNRVVGATVIGGLIIDWFTEQICKQALELNEFYQAQAYAFALTRLNENLSLSCLEEISKKADLDSYSGNIQKSYIAALHFRTGQKSNNPEIIEKTKNFISRNKIWNDYLEGIDLKGKI